MPIEHTQVHGPGRLHQRVLRERLTEVTVRLLSVIFKKVHNDRKETNIAPSLKKDKEQNLGKVIQQILLETVSKYINIKKVIVNSQHGVTMGKMSLTFWAAFSDGLAGCVAKGRADDVPYL
ncbi:RNA-directed DNA polymerase from mobile element jockey-like protein [Pitangus sulphuratus]|nr:RNA-directed DNA polymerase from mobile element jockey-like protein [Pitangus sulphuratus]